MKLFRCYFFVGVINNAHGTNIPLATDRTSSLSITSIFRMGRRLILGLCPSGLLETFFASLMEALLPCNWGMLAICSSRPLIYVDFASCVSAPHVDSGYGHVPATNKATVKILWLVIMISLYFCFFFFQYCVNSCVVVSCLHPWCLLDKDSLSFGREQ